MTKLRFAIASLLTVICCCLTLTLVLYASPSGSCGESITYTISDNALILDGTGIIDADYYNNPNNEGEIFFQLINLAPFAIQLKRGDKIGQGIFSHYETTEDDIATGKREGGFGSTG